MALADWTIEGTGSYSITNATGLGTDTPTNMIYLTPDASGELRFQNDTAGNIENSSIETWARYEFDPGQGRNGFSLRLRGQNNGNNSAYVGYSVLISPLTNTQIWFRLYRTLGGTATNLANSFFTPATAGDMQIFYKYRFSVVTSGGINYLRFERFSGATPIIMMEAADANGAMSVAGKAGFARGNGEQFAALSLDDTKIYSLA